jgi:hypothetical protein
LPLEHGQSGFVGVYAVVDWHGSEYID